MRASVNVKYSLNIEHLFTEVEVNGGGYLDIPSHEAVR